MTLYEFVLIEICLLIVAIMFVGLVMYRIRRFENESEREKK